MVEADGAGEEKQAGSARHPGMDSSDQTWDNNADCTKIRSPFTQLSWSGV